MNQGIRAVFNFIIMTALHLTPIPHTSFFLPKYSETVPVHKKEEETQTKQKMDERKEEK